MEKRFHSIYCLAVEMRPIGLAAVPDHHKVKREGKVSFEGSISITIPGKGNRQRVADSDTIKNNGVTL